MGTIDLWLTAERAIAYFEKPSPEKYVDLSYLEQARQELGW
jgi:hypothetical protein